MTAPRKTFLSCSVVAALIAAGLYLLFRTGPEWPGWLFAVTHGTLFGQTSLAAAWCVLGPFSLARRLPLSAAWLAAIILCFGWNKAGGWSPNVLDRMLTFAVLLPVQAALVAVPLMLVAAPLRLRFMAPNSTPAVLNYQVGIRESLFLTGVVAIVLGGVRYRLGDLHNSSIIWDEAVELACLISANALIAAPAILAMLLARSGLLSVTICLLIVALGTAAELFALSFHPHIGFDWRVCWFVSLLNGFQAAWIMAVPALLRFGGFSLLSISSTPTRQSGSGGMP